MTSGTTPLEDPDAAWLQESLRQCQRDLGELRKSQERYLENEATIDRLSAQLTEVTDRLDEHLRETEHVPAGWRGTVRRRLLRNLPSPAEEADIAVLRSSDLFDGSWYLRQYPEVAGTGLSPALHYLRHGADAGHDPGPSFDTESYRRLNPPVAKSGANPLVHHLLRDKTRPGQ